MGVSIDGKTGIITMKIHHARIVLAIAKGVMNMIQDGKQKSLVGLKKSFIYSNEDEKRFMEGALDVHSIIAKKSASSTLEDIVAEALLPKKPIARSICKQLYSYDIDDLKALEQLFDIYAETEMLEEGRQNGRELVDLLQKKIEYASFPVTKKNEGERLYLLSNIKSIQTIIVKKSEDDKEERNLEFTGFLVSALEEEPDQFRVDYLLRIIKDNWDILGDITYTFRSLASVCRIVKMKDLDTAKSRLATIEAVSHLSR